MRLAITALSLVLALLTTAPAKAQLLNRLERFGKALADQRTPTPANETAYLGLRAEGVPQQAGLIVTEVYAGSPADAAGIQPGDKLLEMNGVGADSLDGLASLVAASRPGDKVKFTIDRRGERQEVLATLGARQTTPSGVGNETLPPPLAPAGRANVAVDERPASLGIRVVAVTEEARQAYGLTVRNGALIAEIDPGSPADQAGLPLGGVVIAAEGRRIEKPDDLVHFIRSQRPGDAVLLSYYQGATLFRKEVRLGVAASEALVPGPAPVDRGASDRPVLRRLEKAIDNFGRPPAAGPSPLPPPDPGMDVSDLRREIDLLRARVQQLEARLEKLEGPVKPAEAKPAAEQPLELKAPSP